MANNLIISYDLAQPGKNYQAIHDAIEKIPAPRVQLLESVFFVKTLLEANHVADILFASMDKNDKLFVIDATHNAIVWRGDVKRIPVTDFVQYHWWSP
jgi:hypothetical protein